jgi:amino acid permease
MLMIAETISLGILSLPAALSTLGLIPGLILLVGLGALASYTGLVIGQFKLVHPEVHSMGDAGYILFGRVGRELLGAGQLIFIVFIMGSHILTFSIMMNAITSHAICTITFMLTGMLISLLFTLPRTLRGLTWLCVASFVSIITAVGTTMIGVSITQPGRLHNGQHNGLGFLDVGLWPQEDISFHAAFLAVANIVFAYAGHVAFFSFISEFRRPRDFPKALALLQCSDMSMYLVSSVVIYYYAGMQVASPALDSASPLVRKIAYGLAIPTIVIAGVVNGHVAVKYLFVRLLRPGGWLAALSGKKSKSRTRVEHEKNDIESERQNDQTNANTFTISDEEDLLHSKGAKAWSIWIAIVTLLWVVAWLISEGVPVFNDLLGLTSALFASWFTYGLSGMFWCHMHLQKRGWRVCWRKKEDGTGRGKVSGKWILLAVNLLCIAVGAVICGAGLYSSGRSIGGHAGEGRSFACVDNS